MSFLCFHIRLLHSTVSHHKKTRPDDDVTQWCHSFLCHPQQVRTYSELSWFHYKFYFIYCFCSIATLYEVCTVKLTRSIIRQTYSLTDLNIYCSVSSRGPQLCKIVVHCHSRSSESIKLYCSSFTNIFCQSSVSSALLLPNGIYCLVRCPSLYISLNFMALTKPETHIQRQAALNDCLPR